MAFQGSSPISRRACLPLIAAALSVPAAFTAAPARAKGAWQIFRREDLGFEVEMPGEPKIDTEAGDRTDEWIRTVDAQVTFEDVLYGVNFQEFRRDLSIQDESAAQRLTVRAIEGRVAREAIATTSDGGGMLDLAIESDGVNMAIRVFIVKNRRFMGSATGGRSVHASEPVQRFLRSFKLLPAAR